MNLSFESYNNWLYEREMITQPRYGCVMLLADIPHWKEHHLSMILPEDIYNAPSMGMTRGLETMPHITLLYGLYLNAVKPLEIKKLMETFFPLQITINKIDVIHSSSCDVVVYNIPAKKELKFWRDELLRFPNYQHFSTFKPHITISYVKKGTGAKYIRELDNSFKVIFNKAMYSFSADENRNITIELDK
jgi:2'-5' RNA ligase